MLGFEKVAVWFPPLLVLQTMKVSKVFGSVAKWARAVERAPAWIEVPF